MCVHARVFEAKYLKTVRDRGSGPMDSQYGESVGHVIDDVTWPWKVKIVDPKTSVVHYLEDGYTYRLLQWAT